ncbi:GNAT family N-acetyltransferase [Flavobacterium sp. '19STA2R22 D10 B1']|uniref:GNAT family N-acetyltransferase n=1 Tax=Flavobacterium aerium TaxID=3037261 RepID=UPI00278C8277|nr:GNAT family protein [Flavobacterium sp. '19STA2R22 D10 B1']
MIQLETERLVLRDLSIKDNEVIHQLLSNPETNEFSTLEVPKNVTATKKIVSQWIEEQEKTDRTSHIFAIINQETNEFIGLISIQLNQSKFNAGEIWYKLHPYFWKEGYATESVNAILNFGFHTLNLHRIESKCAINNTDSIKVLKKSGFVQEGCKRKALPLKMGWTDCYFFGILDEDFKKKF